MCDISNDVEQISISNEKCVRIYTGAVISNLTILLATVIFFIIFSDAVSQQYLTEIGRASCRERV